MNCCVCLIIVDLKFIIIIIIVYVPCKSTNLVDCSSSSNIGYCSQHCVAWNKCCILTILKCFSVPPPGVFLRSSFDVKSQPGARLSPPSGAGGVCPSWGPCQWRVSLPEKPRDYLLRPTADGAGVSVTPTSAAVHSLSRSSPSELSTVLDGIRLDLYSRVINFTTGPLYSAWLIPLMQGLELSWYTYQL